MNMNMYMHVYVYKRTSNIHIFCLQGALLLKLYFNLHNLCNTVEPRYKEVGYNKTLL